MGPHRQALWKLSLFKDFRGALPVAFFTNLLYPGQGQFPLIRYTRVFLMKIASSGDLGTTLDTTC